MDSKQRLRILCLYKILSEKTDDEHSVTVQDIIAELDRLGINAERKTLYTDIKALNVFGADIIGQKVGRGYEYHMGSRHFEIAELKLLVDAVQSSRFITQRNIKTTTERL